MRTSTPPSFRVAAAAWAPRNEWAPFRRACVTIARSNIARSTTTASVFLLSITILFPDGEKISAPCTFPMIVSLQDTMSNTRGVTRPPHWIGSPISRCSSRSATSYPAFAIRPAAYPPAGPAPTTMTSNSSAREPRRIPSLLFCHQDQQERVQVARQGRVVREPARREVRRGDHRPPAVRDDVRRDQPLPVVDLRAFRDLLSLLRDEVHEDAALHRVLDLLRQFLPDLVEGRGRNRDVFRGGVEHLADLLHHAGLSGDRVDELGLPLVPQDLVHLVELVETLPELLDHLLLDLRGGLGLEDCRAAPRRDREPLRYEGLEDLVRGRPRDPGRLRDHLRAAVAVGDQCDVPPRLVA